MLHSLTMVESGRNITVALQHMRQVYSNLVGLQGSLSQDMTELLSAVSDCINAAEQKASNESDQYSDLLFEHAVPRISQPLRRGPSSYNICNAQLQFLINHGFSASTIARLFHASLSTVRRRLRLVCTEVYMYVHYETCYIHACVLAQIMQVINICKPACHD